MEISENIQSQLDLLPNRTGIYKFYSSENEILYIGKALNLRSRVYSYFRDTHSDRPQIITMIPLIERIQIVETENEVEALVLEAALIKKHQPKYNSMLKDGKSYAYIYIDTRSEFPTVKVVRNLTQSQHNKGRVFGPYPNGKATKQLFRYIRKLYPFCTCVKPKEPCLYFHMGQCPGPFFGNISVEEYRENINQIIKFLEGKRKRHIGELEKEMGYYASLQEFERAAELRDKIADLKHLGHQVKFSELNPEIDYRDNRKLMLLSELEQIAEVLNMPDLKRIECYDISNIQGKMSYGSMVVTIDGESSSADYRIFKIKEKDTPDDFAMLNEVLKRRLAHIDKDNVDSSLNAKPDLILIDGGKGQLSAVRDLIPENIQLLGISKGRHMKRKGMRKKDQFWKVEGDETVQVRIQKPRILVNLRDEAHRFALKHHRKLRKFTQKKSVLDGIKGIGPKKKKGLIQKFGSVANMKGASLEDINSVVKNEKLSKEVLEAIKS
jgi:excinuclease ABC subunit C